MNILSNPEALDSDDLLYLASICEDAQCYQEMLEFMKLFISKSSQSLPMDGRRLLSVALQNISGSLRTSWRVINAVEKSRGSWKNALDTSTLKSQVEAELLKHCTDTIALIDQKVLPKELQLESQLYFLKTKGDYFRYIAEFAQGPTRTNAMNNAETSYATAFEMAKSELTPIHPSRLGLILNFSLFFYEIRNEQERACELAKTGYDEAIAELEKIDSGSDSYYLVTLLKDNLTLWSTEDFEGNH